MTEKEQHIIDQTKEYVRSTLEGEGSGHDWWHIVRVHNNAIHLGKEENADMFIVELAALLHDIADYKFHNGDESIGPRVASEWLTAQGVEENKVKHVAHIIQHLSFKGAQVENHIDSIEGMIVQDADRLDALGAIGIGRTFAYGGHAGREMYNPNIQPVLHDSPEAYKQNNSPTINHFYEKLLLLKDLMNTETAKKIAQERHVFMEQYLEQFYKEWNGEA